MNRLHETHQAALQILVAAFTQNQGFFVVNVPRIHERLRHLVRCVRHHLHHGNPELTQALLRDELLRLFGVHVPVPRYRQLSLLAGAIRHVLVGYFRLRQSKPEGGVELLIDELHRQAQPIGGRSIDILAVDAALNQLHKRFPLGANLLELHYFACLAVPYIALETNRPMAEIRCDMRFAKTWLLHYLQGRI